MFVYYECYVSIELTFLKEFMLIKQVQQKSVIFVTIAFLSSSLKFQPSACNRCHGLLMMSLNLSDIGVLNIKGSDYRCIISQNEATHLFQNTDLTKKSGTLENLNIYYHV